MSYDKPTSNANDAVDTTRNEETAPVRRRLVTHIPYLFLAFPIIAMTLMIDLPDARIQALRPLKATAMFFVPAVFSCIAILLLFACIGMLQRKRDAMASHRILLLPSVLLLATGCIMLLADDLRVFTITLVFPLSGALIGIGGGMLALFWAKAYSRLDPEDIFIDTAISYAVGLLLAALISLLPVQLDRTLISLFLVICSAVPLEYIFSNGPTAETYGSKTRPFRQILPDFWKPLAGSILCLMIAGCSWGTSLATLDFSGRDVNYLIEDLSLMASALIILVSFLMLRGHAKGLAIFLHAIPVVAAALLLLSWFLALIDRTLLSTLSNIVIGLAQGAIYVITWYSLAVIAARGERDVFNLFGTMGAVALTVMLGCMALGTYLEEAAQYVTPIFTVIYLVLVNFDFGKSRNAGSQDGSDDAPHASDDHPNEQRLDQIAETYHLSPRERELLPFLVRGLSVGYIADALCISLNTAKTHTRRVYEKLGVHSRDALIALIDSTDTRHASPTDAVEQDSR